MEETKFNAKFSVYNILRILTWVILANISLIIFHHMFDPPGKLKNRLKNIEISMWRVLLQAATGFRCLLSSRRYFWAGCDEIGPTDREFCCYYIFYEAT